MLAYLAIRDFTIIDKLSVEFAPGFSVLTGETGAGKSILIQALHLLLGGRASADMIRTDTDAAEVEAEFKPPPGSRILGRLAELELLEGDTVSIRRVISRSGRNRAFVNGRMVNLTKLAELTGGLVDISGQHEHVELTDEDTHREILDDFGSLHALREQVRQGVRRMRRADQEVEALAAQEAKRAEREEFLSYSLRRIDELDPKPGEVETLQQELTRLRNVGKLADGIRSTLGMLYEHEGSAVEAMGAARSELAGLISFDADLSAIHDRLQTTLRQLEDIARDLQDSAGSLEADPLRMEEAEERLAALRGLMRTQGTTIEAVLLKRAEMQTEIDSLESLVDRRKEAQARRDQLSDEAMALARGLSARRLKVAGRLKGKLTVELHSLAMKDAQVEVEVSTGGPDDLEEWGLDQVRFLLSANPGEEVRPLARVASGGELSRILLGLKAVLSEVDRVPTYVFDEVDAGVGGAVAQVIGEKLSAVAARHQVLCITHLPQIAAHAMNHFTVAKKVIDKRTMSAVKLLQEPERVEEIARMAGGRAVSDKARGHARDLLKNARK